MSMPFLWPAVSFAAGILAHSLYGWVLPKQIFWIILTANFPLLWWLRGRRTYLPLFCLMLAILAQFFSYLHMQVSPLAIQYWAEDSSDTFQTRRMSLEGVVASDPEIKENGKKKTVSFVLDAKNLMIRRQASSPLLASEIREGNIEKSEDQSSVIYDAEGKVQVFLFQSASVPSYGDRVRLWGHLEKARPVANPGGFDYGAYLAQQGIDALFKAYGKYSLRVIKEKELHPFLIGVHQLRMKIEARIERTFKPDVSSLLKAMLIGRRKAIDPEVREYFMKTGTAHLLAISGLHIALVSGSLYLFLIFAGVRQKFAILGTLLAIALHVLIAGAAIPVRRAGLMAAIGFIAVLFDRERNSLNTFCFAVILFLITNPENLTNLSFQLSFISVLSLVLVLKEIKEGWQWTEIWLRTLAVMVGTFPIVVFYFHTFSFASIFTNLLAIPMFHFSLLSALWVMMVEPIPFFGKVMVPVTEWGVRSAVEWIKLWASWDWGYVFLKSPSWPQMIGYYVLLFIYGFLHQMKLKKFSILKYSVLTGWLTLCLFFFQAPSPKQFVWTLFSAGKNEMVHIQFGGCRHWLINTGRGQPSNQARWILEPFLKEKGQKYLEGILLTDYAQKHIGAFRSITESFLVQSVFLPEKGYSKKGVSLREKTHRRMPWKKLREGNQITISPTESIRVLSDGTQGLTLWIGAGGYSILMLPCVSEEIIQTVKENRADLNHLKVLVLPSMKDFQMSLFEQLINEVDPDIAMIPSELPALREFFYERDIPLFDTETYGALSVSQEKLGSPLVVNSYLKGRILEMT